MRRELEGLIGAILCAGSSYHDGVHQESVSPPALFAAVYQWSHRLGRDFSEILRGLEPSLRQSILMSLLPAKALRASFRGSFDAAIQEHLDRLDLKLETNEVVALRNLLINIRKLQGLDSKQARSKTETLAGIKGSGHHGKLWSRQNGRCYWCGVALDDVDVFETLEHLVPKHLGDDPQDGSNWALACSTCNFGKGDAFAWSATPWAHDYMQRNQFVGPDVLEANHRWVVLRRTPNCDTCGTKSTNTELVIYRRVQTGLAIPANCSTTCRNCAMSESREILDVNWADKEAGRAQKMRPHPSVLTAHA